MSNIWDHDPDYGSVFTRMMIRLEPGEEQPSYPLQLDPPAGYRWETDAELRARVKRSLETTP